MNVWFEPVSNKRLVLHPYSSHRVAISNSLPYIIKFLNKNAILIIVTNGNSDDITVIDITRMVAIKSIPVGRTPHSIKILK